MQSNIHNPQDEEFRKIAESHISWWRDAGCDWIIGQETEPWLAPTDNNSATETAEKPQQTKSEKQPGGKGEIRAPSQKTPAAPMVNKQDWPDSLEQLHLMLKEKAILPGNHYGGNVALPQIASSANGFSQAEKHRKLLLIGDIPEAEEVESGYAGTGSYAELAKRMMQAVGYQSEEYSWHLLATTRPATGAIPDKDVQMLGDFMKHQIALQKPDSCILFGSTACKALLDADLMNARGILHYINYDGHKVATLTTFHPRTLLARPKMKAQAWRDLQVLL